MKVTPVSKTLADVLRGNFLRIPRFQRPYDWDRDNLTEFWNDLKDRAEPEYFMGSLVVFNDSKEKNLLSLVDGQQRITTITIMLAIIRNLLESIGETGPAKAIHDLIESRDLDDRSRFVLEHDPADRYLQQAIQMRKPDLKLSPDGVQQENLQNALRYLDSAVRSHIKGEFADNKIKTSAYLKHLRDCILQMHFVSIELDNEDDAYLIFETLNTRGKDLRASDLLKNHFMRLLPQRTKGLDIAKNQWSDTIEKLNSVTVAIDPDSFLLHYWLANHSSVSKAKLFLSYKAEIKKSNAKQWLESIKIGAATYVRIIAPNEEKFAKEERSLKESLQAIRVFGVTQAAPLLLAIMTQYERKAFSLKAVRSAVELIERFTFQFNALTQSRGGGGVSNMYAKLAQTTMSCDDGQDFAKVVSEMKAKFRERVPDETEFSLRFSRIIYRTNYTRERNLVKYVLTKLAQHFGMPGEVDTNMLTIEHILSQSEGEETGDEFDYGAIGNLLFVNDDVNGKVGTKDFKNKLKYFTPKNQVYMDPMLSSATEWKVENIGARGVELARIGYNKIWNV
ncbi:DUF262 domain-containing protein [Shinella sp.]|uniref:DUF262 domain-containing protein n=1 Tax=Shinella sp. TaxID=1870904 RepID=UPI002587923D|nr:DUF262 domain-containing protein [Shinella sp.]MCW5710550.1 DUF262 domain-containing protein [Shinella sp.]